MNAAHHGELELRRYELGELQGEARSRVEGHLSGCETCRGRLADLALADRRFRADFPFERFAAGVERASRERARRRPLPRLVVPGLALAAAAGVLVTFAVRGPVELPSSRTKGGASVDVYVGGEGGTRVAASRELLRPGERLRVAYRAAGLSYVTVVSVDESGEVSAVYPESGESLSTGDGTVILPGSIELTGSGLERLVIVLTQEPLEVTRVAAEAEAALRASGGDLDRMADLDVPGEQFHRIFMKP